jgi:hypothetical protein
MSHNTYFPFRCRPPRDYTAEALAAALPMLARGEYPTGIAIGVACKMNTNRAILAIGFLIEQDKLPPRPVRKHGESASEAYRREASTS